MESEKVDTALEIYKEYELPPEESAIPVLTVLLNDIKKGHFKRAAQLITGFTLPEDKVQEVGVSAFKQKMGIANYQSAKIIADTLKLKKELIEPIIQVHFSALVDKTLYEKALFIAREFNQKSQQVTEAAFTLFGQRLKGGYYEQAARLAKDFKLPKDSVQKHVTKLLEMLETKKDKKRADLLRNSFSLQKKGLAKFLGI